MFAKHTDNVKITLTRFKPEKYLRMLIKTRRVKTSNMSNVFAFNFFFQRCTRSFSQRQAFPQNYTTVPIILNRTVKKKKKKSRSYRRLDSDFDLGARHRRCEASCPSNGTSSNANIDLTLIVRAARRGQVPSKFRKGHTNIYWYTQVLLAILLVFLLATLGLFNFRRNFFNLNMFPRQLNSLTRCGFVKKTSLRKLYIPRSKNL